MIQRCAIIGAGISGLAAAYFLQKRIPAVSIDIYDEQKRAGGVIRTEKISGCVVEAGPDSFLTIKKAASRLCEEIGLGSQLVGSNDAARKTFIFQDTALKELPDGFFLMVPTKIKPMLTNDLLTWPGKLEMLSDLFSNPEDLDCSVSDFVDRRFGSEVLQRIAEPMISGIYGADVKRLSLQSALPQIWELQKNGSLILQLLKRERGVSGESLFTTLENGMESLVESLRQKISAVWNLGQPVPEIRRTQGGWSIQNNTYDAVLLAGSKLPFIEVPSFESLHSVWQTIRKNSAVVIVAGFRGLQKKGFGWLVPAQERHSILACTYLTNKFPRRSPPDLFLLRAFIGGEQAERWIQCSDEAIYEEMLNELQRISGITGTPEFHRIFRWLNAMPEYHVGHRATVETIRNLVRPNQGLYVTGNIFGGVGIPDCIQHAENVVDEIVIQS